MATTTEIVDLTTCEVCFEQYDLEDKKPKFLRCSHSLCLSCAKGVYQGNRLLRCPFCRFVDPGRNAESLPNNNYATQIVRLIEKRKKTTPETSPRKMASMSWCSICQSAQTSLCEVLGHSTTSMTSEAMRNMKEMIQNRTELTELKDQGMDTLAQIFQKRRRIEEYLSLVMKSIHSVEHEVKRLQDDNNFVLAKVVPILESRKQSVAPNTVSSSQDREESEDDVLTSELMSMIEDFNPNDSIETVKCKLRKALAIYAGYLQETTTAASCYDVLDKTKVAVMLNKGMESPTLTLDLTKNNRVEQDALILLTHTILSLLDTKDLLPTSLENFKRNSSIHSGVYSAVDRTISSNSFILGQSIFILKISKLGEVRDEILIRPCTNFNNELVQKLGTYCYKSPRALKSSVQVEPDTFVLLSGAHMGPMASGQNNQFAEKALEEDEVGLQVVQMQRLPYSSIPTSDVEIQWNMIFPLTRFKTSARMQNSSYKAELFGKIIKRKPETLTRLSSTVTIERLSVNYTLESV